MKFAILNTDYPDFLHWLYAEHVGLENQPYDGQMRVRNESLFGVADFYSSNLRKLGHEAWDIHANNEFMQMAWAKEYGIHLKDFTSPNRSGREALLGAMEKKPLEYLKTLFRRKRRPKRRKQSWFYDVLAAQIRHHRPDVLLSQDMFLSCQFFKEIKSQVRLLVGQHAATHLPNSEDFSCYDLLISSFPPTVDYFRKKGIPAELNRMGFEPRVLSYLEDRERNFEVTFIGSFNSVHSSRIAWLESLCVRLPNIKIWAPKIDRLPETSPVRKSYIGQTWGRQMYQILDNSRITLNHHGDIPPYANNMRLFEATGVGTLLITDWKVNLHEMFEPGKEVVAYRSPEECVELITYYLQHDRERKAIARAGQERTLRQHTYNCRMQELVDIVRKCL